MLPVQNSHRGQYQFTCEDGTADTVRMRNADGEEVRGITSLMLRVDGWGEPVKVDVTIEFPQFAMWVSGDKIEAELSRETTDRLRMWPPRAIRQFARQFLDVADEIERELSEC